MTNQNEKQARGSTSQTGPALASPSAGLDSLSFQVTPQITLAANAFGPVDGEPVLLIHGIGQTRGTWNRVAPLIAEQGFRVISIDLRGHGDSSWSPEGDYSLDAFAADVHAVIADLGGAPLVVGASLGGLSAILACGESKHIQPKALALIDIVPWIDGAEGSHVRDFMRGTAEGFDTVEAAADAVHQYLPHRPRPQSTDGLIRNLRPTPDGRLCWHWDPAVITPREDWDLVALNARLQTAAQAISIPIMLVRGSKSEIVSETALNHFREMLPDAEIVEIPDARHMVVGDDNGSFLTTASEFLSRHSNKEVAS